MHLEVTHVCKRYPGVLALDDVSIGVAGGEVLAVIGENGAGKSTLMKVLAGIVRPDEGEVRIDGTPVVLKGPADAIDRGISLIHQELNLHENLSVAENLFLGREPSRWGWIDRRGMDRQSRLHLAGVGLDVDPATPLKELNTASRQLVEIAKAVSTGAAVVIMDEPTSSLSLQETERLIRVVDKLKTDGVAVIYISHRLAEVQRLADRVEVLRDGRNSGALSRSQCTHDAMVSAMVGRDLSRLYQRQARPTADPSLPSVSTSKPVLSVKNVTIDGGSPIDLHVHAGEVVGIAGLVGSGRTELLETVFGVRRCSSPSDIRVLSKKITAGDAGAAMRAGVGLVPEDRKRTGLLLHSSVRGNATVAALPDSPSAPWISERWESTSTQELIEKLAIKTASQQTTINTLSGGNQQKVALGKWLLRRPKVLLLDEPTRGVDIGAKQEIYTLLDRLAGEGLAILFVSSELEEVIALSDRVLVMHDRRLSGELTGPDINEEAIMRAAVGGETVPRTGPRG